MAGDRTFESMSQQVLRICESIRDAGGRAMLVGGSVRDLLLGIESKDFDIEVYGIPAGRLREILGRIGRVSAVGESFAVYKLSFEPDERAEIDVSIPRRESKSGPGHRGFAVGGDPTMTFEEAARRRDFTVNAILFDPLTGETVDPYNGTDDLKRRVLRAVAADTFVEDSLRVLRAMQLAARFEMTVEPKTVEICQSVDLSDLPRERIWGEFEKLLTRAQRPSIGLAVALDLRVLDKLFPEIRALDGCPQNPELHPEGDAFAHTRMCVDEAVKLIGGLPAGKRIAVMLGALCHDLGKPLTIRVEDGRVSSPGHDEAGVAPTRTVLDTLGIYTLAGYDVRLQVLALVREHLRPQQFYLDRDRITDGMFRRLSGKVEMDLLYRLAKANALSRSSASSSAAPDWFIDRVRSLGIEHEPPQPVLLGRHLMEAGFEPGPRMGEILRYVYELQLDGQVNSIEEGLAAARCFRR